jgi:branched-chain amino acid transport system substrate-binding protein
MARPDRHRGPDQRLDPAPLPDAVGEDGPDGERAALLVGSAEFGFPPTKAGFELTDTGRFQPFTDDFSAQISAFKQAEVEIVTGNLTLPDFATFWAQAAQQGFKPKIVTIGKALLFPSSIATLGERGDGLSTER